jgi:ribosomal protein S18 acetylase RimI-like enzyme
MREKVSHPDIANRATTTDDIPAREQARFPGFTIRVATTNDIPALTELHCASFRPEDHVPVMLGRDYVHATYRWLVTSNRSYCLVADSDAKIIGLIGVCDGPFTRPMLLACLPELIKSVFRSPRLLLRKEPWSRLLRRPDVSRTSKNIADHPGFAQMTIGAVDAECRGTGVFPALVEATKTYSKSRGSRAIRAGVYKINQPSSRVFVKGGWIETPELETTDTVFYVHYIDPDFPNELGISGERP